MIVEIDSLRCENSYPHGHVQSMLTKGSFLTWRNDGSKLQRKIDEPLFVPVNFSQIKTRPDLADLIANPLRDERRLRVVENDAFLAIEPAGPFVNLRDDRIEPERKYFIF